MNKKIVYDLTPFSHLDYPNHLACIIWLAGCNMRCDYCYNKDIVLADIGTLTFNNILSFLDTRINLLDGVVISGGEATTHNLIKFCQEIKSKGFKIKLDTNGINFEHIKKLIEFKLIDYISLDYKAPKYKFTQITHLNIKKFDNFEKTLNYLININFCYEIRTTIHSDLISTDDINFIINDLIEKGYKGNYFLQNYLNTTTTIGDIKDQTYIVNLENIQDKDDSIKIKYRNF